jgi:integrase
VPGLVEWLSTYEDSVRRKTFEQHIQVANQHLASEFASLKLRDLRADHIQALCARRVQDGKSQRTMLMIPTVLHGALNQALRWGLIGCNPDDAVNRRMFKKRGMQTLNQDQVKELSTVARCSTYETLFWVAVTAGLRQGELLGLKWSDPDWVTRRLSIQRPVQRIRGRGPEFSVPKSEAGRRSVFSTSEPLRGCAAITLLSPMRGSLLAHGGARTTSSFLASFARRWMRVICMGSSKEC